MKKFLVLYTAGTSAQEKMKESDPEAAKEGMKQWMAWAEKCGDALVDLGSPLGPTEVVTEDGWAAGKPGVAGYSILQAEDMEAAKALLEDHPHMGWDASCTIELHEMLPMPSAE